MRPCITEPANEDGVTRLLEYIIISGVLLVLMIVMMFTVNAVFMDGSLRKVDLKELWTLQWAKWYDTAGPWTKAGGVLPEDWPAWMRKFKDY